MKKIISVHSYRGGTGKSNIIANLAALFAQAGKRVALVDTDIQSPGVHLLFGLGKENIKYTLNEFLHGQCSIEEAAYPIGELVTSNTQTGYSQLQGCHLWVVPSNIDGLEITRILRNGYDANLLNQGLHTIHQELDLDYLFLDTHPGLNDETLLSIAISDTLVVVMRPDQQDFQGTIVTVDVARSLEVPHLYLLVNKSLSRYDFAQVQETVEDVYETPVVGVLPLHEDIADLASSDLFALRYPNHRWSQTLKSVAKHLLENK